MKKMKWQQQKIIKQRKYKNGKDKTKSFFFLMTGKRI